MRPARLIGTEPQIHRRRSGTGWIAVGCLPVILAAACGDAGPAPSHPPPDVRLVHLADAGPIPYSTSEALAALGPDRACVLDSYAPAIVCGDREWRTVSYEREGRGPGEIRGYGDLLSGPGGSLVLIDSRNDQLMYFTSRLEFQRSVGVPPILLPAGEVSDDSLLLAFRPSMPGGPGTRLLTVSAATGEIVGERVLPLDPQAVGRDTATLTGGVRAPDGRFLVRIHGNGRTDLAWYTADGQLETVLAMPDMPPAYPSERDSVHIEEVFRQRAGRSAPPGWHRYRNRPIGPLPRADRNRSLQVDARGRAWVLSTRPVDGGTALEIFEGPEHQGTVEVSGRVVAFQIVDTVLVALVEAVERAPDGLYPRRIAWYGIEETPTD